MRETDHLAPSIPQAIRNAMTLGDAWTRERRVVDPRVTLYADDVRQRLRHICCDWSERDFEDLVRQIARMKVRWHDLDRAD